MASASNYLKAGGIALAVTYVRGLAIVVGALAWVWINGKLLGSSREVPPLSWWQIALAPLVLGLLVGVLRMASGPLFSSSTPQWKKAVFLVGLLLALAAYAFLST